MIRSMTGFGSAAREDDGRRYSVEVRSVNARYFKASVRLADELTGLEADMESRLSRRLSRGSVTVAVKFSDRSADAAAEINIAAVGRYIEQMQMLPGYGDGAVVIDAATLLTLPGTLNESTGGDRVAAARPIVDALLEEATDEMVAMREREGVALREDLEHHASEIERNLEEVARRAPIVVELFQERLRQRMDALLKENGANARDEDLLREVAVFAERSDIAEEINRLRGHMVQFRDLLSGDGTRPVGRTMDFLAQEMLREANTIGSKCLDVEVGRRIVEVKGAIDRLKEQVQNVE
jgi:uncharacterized protein (TIGR00255 family)